MSSELVKFELNCIQAIQLILSLYQFQAKKQLLFLYLIMS